MRLIPRAQQRRLDRAELLRQLRGREIEAIDLVVCTPECLRTMFVFDFLRQVPRIGPTKIREINRRAILDHVNLAVSMGEMQTGKRRWLADQLERRRGERRHPLLSQRPQG